MTWAEWVEAACPSLSDGEQAARKERLDGVYTRAGYRALEMDRFVNATVGAAVEAVHGSGATAIQQAPSTAVMAGR